MFLEFNKNDGRLLPPRGEGRAGDVCRAAYPLYFSKPAAAKKRLPSLRFRKIGQEKIDRLRGDVPSPFPLAGYSTEWPVAIRFARWLRHRLDRHPADAVYVWGLCPHAPEVYRFTHNEDRKKEIRQEKPQSISRRISSNRLHRAVTALRLLFSSALSSANRNNLNTAPFGCQGENLAWQFLLPAR